MLNFDLVKSKLSSVYNKLICVTSLAKTISTVKKHSMHIYLSTVQKFYRMHFVIASVSFDYTIE